MLRVKEFIKASKLNWALGERSYGHFDHDAKRLYGPRDHEEVPRCENNVLTKPSTSLKAKTKYKISRNHITGENCMKVVPSRKSKKNVK